MMCTGRNWCDFFLCTSKEEFLEKIYFDQELMVMAVQKAKIVYEKLIFPELKYRLVKKDIEDTKCVKDVVNNLVDIVCSNINDNDIDFLLDLNWEMSI